MTGKQYARLLKALGMSPADVCERLHISRTTEWRCRDEGPPHLIGECLTLLLQVKRLERLAARAQDRFGRPRISTHESESKRGSIPAAVVRPRKRKGKAELRAEAERLITKD